MVIRKHYPAMRLIVAILTLCLFAPTVSVSAQNAPRPPLTNDDVIQMVTANLSESLILSQIADSQTRFDLSTPELIRLSASGVSDTIIEAMRTPSAAADTRPPQPVVAPVVESPDAAVVAPVAPVVAPVAQAPSAGGMPLSQNFSTELKWAGIALWSAGTTMEILSYTALKHKEEACGYVFLDFVCYSEENTNWPIFYSGLGASLAGILMWYIGDQEVPLRPSIDIGRGFSRVTLTGGCPSSC